MPKPHSESFAWQEVARLARAAWARVTNPQPELHAIQQIARGMLGQVRRGVHANPPLLVFANPREDKASLVSQHVLAVLYVHTDDGEQYVHGFGNAALDLDTAQDGTVTIAGLAERTDVEMLALKDGSVLLRGRHGQRLWDTF